VTLTDVEVIKIAAETAGGDEAVFSAAQLSGKTYTIKAASYDANNTFKVVGASTTTAIDLSTLTIDNTVSYGITGVVTDASANTTSSVTITGTALADTITGGSKADTISAGLGADNITGGNGNDTITITEATASQSVDTVVLAAAGNGYDTIIGFKTGTDKVTLGDATEVATPGAATVEASGATVVVGTSGGLAVDLRAGIDTEAVDVIELSAALSSNGTLDNALDGAELLKAFSSTAYAATGFTMDSGAGAASSGFLLAYQNDNAYLYFYNSTDATVVASEITLVAKLTGITAGSLGNDFIAI